MTRSASSPPGPDAPSPRLVLCLITDRTMLPGFFVTLHTALPFVPRAVDVCVLGKGLAPADVSVARRMVEESGRLFEHIAVDESSFRFGGSLRGSMMPYLLYLVPQIVDASRIVLLDVDMVVRGDLAPLFERPLVGACAAVASGFAHRSIDGAFFAAQGIPSDAPCFNTGCVVFDTEAWEREKLSERCVAFSEQYASQFMAADQTAFNCVVRETCDILGTEFNTVCYPFSHEPVPADARVIHMLGAPKPWVYFVGRRHSQHAAFKAAHDRLPAYARRRLALPNAGVARQSARAILSLAKREVAALVRPGRVRPRP